MMQPAGSLMHALVIQFPITLYTRKNVGHANLQAAQDGIVYSFYPLYVLFQTLVSFPNPIYQGLTSLTTCSAYCAGQWGLGVYIAVCVCGKWRELLCQLCFTVLLFVGRNRGIIE